MATPDTQLTIELATLLKGLGPTLKGLGQVEKSLKAVANLKARDTQKTLRQTADSSKKLADTQQRLINRQKQLEASSIRATNALERARLATQRLEQSKSRLARNTLPALDKQLNKISRSLTSIGGGLRSFGTSLTVGLTAPLTALGVLATKNAVTLDSLKRGLVAITGSADDAAVQLERLREIAKAPGIGFQEAIQGSIRLQAVGFSALEAERALKQFANAVALTGGGRDELERVTVQLGQLAAKGKVVAQDLKPIIEAAPAVGQALLKAFGTVNSEDIQKLGLSTDQFLEKLLTALDDLPTAAAGAKNAFENFSDSVFVASSAIGEAILPPLTRIINTLEPIILNLAESFRSLSPEIQTVVIAVAALAAAAGPVLFVLGSIINGVGALIFAITNIAAVIGAIGFPELLLVLAALAVQVTALVTVAAALFQAWRTNFLGIRDTVAKAVRGIVNAFNQIKAVINEATQRILPTLESITSKVVRAITAVWERFGKRIFEIVGPAFELIIDTTTFFLRQFGNFIDLVLKLIDGDWRGAWQAFSRIVINAIEKIPELLRRLQQIVVRAVLALVKAINSLALEFVVAAQNLAIRFAASLAAQLVKEAVQIRDALVDMFLAAALSFNPTSAAALIVARFLAAMKKAASESITTLPVDTSFADAGAGGSFKKKPGSRPGVATGGDKAASDALDKLRQAQDEFTSAQEEARLANVRAGVEQQFQLTKDGLDRELETLKANFEDRIVVIKKFFAERKRLEEAAIDAELVREKALSGALEQEFANRRAEIQREFETARKDIERDPKLKGRARELALQTAEQKRQTDLTKAQTDFETQAADVGTRILILQRQRKRVAEDLTREEKNLTDELQRQQDQIQADLIEEQGNVTDAAAVRLAAQFKETLKELRVDLSNLSPELQSALNNVDLSVLKSKLDELPEPVKALIELLDIGIQKARIAEQSIKVDRTLAELRLQEVAIQNKVLDGVLTEREARAQILAMQELMRGRLLDTLAAQLAIAKATKGQEDEVIRIQQQIQEIERLGKVADQVGQDINRALFEDIGSGLEDLLNGARKGFEGLKEAALGFLDNLLRTLNHFAAEGILQKLEGVFKPDSENTKGTPGGFLAKLFGLSPKAADTTALTTAAAAAGTSLTTGATAASAALTTGGATAGTTLLTSVTAAATSFSAAVIAAGAAFAASIAAGGAAQGLGGLGSALGGAATGIFPAVPGGVVRIVEGGYPEAVLTTDPKHAAQQVQILKTLLKKTKGFYGRVRIPEFAEGGFISARDAEMNLLSSIQRSPSFVSTVPDSALASGAGGMELRLRQIFVDDNRSVTDYLNSPQGEQVIVEKLVRNQHLIKRLAR